MHDPSDQRNPDDPIGVLFICMGNICRSPLAEGVFLHRIERRGVAHRFLVDSAGTGGWHAGERADPRTIAIAQRHAIGVPSIARQVRADDWTRFHYLLVMDAENHAGIVRAGAPRHRIHYLRSFDPALRAIDDPAALAVPDPYYGGADGFQTVFDQVSAACDGLLDTLLQRHPEAPR